MKIYMSDNVPEIIEKGGSVTEHPLWSHLTSGDGTVRWWIGADPATWEIIVNLLHYSGPEGKALAAAIAENFHMTKGEL